MFKFTLLFYLLLFNCCNAFAEYCDMVGVTENYVTWIHIPRSQLEDNGRKEINLNGKLYKHDRSDRLFVKDEVPHVNDIVVLNRNFASSELPSCLLLNNCSKEELHRWEIIQQVNSNPTIYENGSATIDTSDYECTGSGGMRGCWDLNEGAKLEILSFTSIKGILFALVRVKDC